MHFQFRGDLEYLGDELDRTDQLGRDLRPSRHRHRLRRSHLSRRKLTPLSLLAGFCTQVSRAKSCQWPGTPFSSWLPRSSKVNGPPTTVPETAPDTRTSPGPAHAPIRDATWTAMPAMSSPINSHSPV